MNKIKYKLVDRDGYTRRGEVGETCWLDGLEKIAEGSGKKLCSSDIIHYYDHPLLAVLFNVIHANIDNSRLIEIEIDGEVAHNGLKGGCKKAKYTKEIELPTLTIEQRVTFAIKISLEYYKDADYGKWASNWLIGKDRGVESAERAAESAAESTTGSVAWAACVAASAAERAAESAAWAERAAARAASAAASAAESVANAAEINKLFIKTIEGIK